MAWKKKMIKGKYLAHDYKIEGEELPKELERKFSRKTLMISILLVVIPFSILNFVFATIKASWDYTGHDGILDLIDVHWELARPIFFLKPVFSIGVYIGVTILGVLLGMFFYSKLKYKHKENISYGQKGDSRFTTQEEMDEQYIAIPEKEKSFKGVGGIPVSHYKDKYYVDTDTVNSAILGVSRSGKGEMVIVPMIDNLSRAEIQSSLVVNDPKGELYAASKDTLEKRGYEVQVLNILSPLESMSYNPLQLAIDAWAKGDIEEAAKRVNTLTFAIYNKPDAGENDFFNTSAQNAINGIVLAIMEDCFSNNTLEKITMHNVSQMLNELGTLYYKENEDDLIEKSALDEYFKNLPQGNIAKLKYGSTSFAGEKAKGSILATANQGLQIFTDSMFGKMTSKSSFDLKQVGFPKSLFFQLDERFLNERVTVTFCKNEKENGYPIIGKQRLKVKALGMCNFNFDYQLSSGDLLLIEYEDEKKLKSVLSYELTFVEKDAKIRNVLRKLEYEKEVKLTCIKNNFPVEPKIKLMYTNKPTAVFMIVPDYDKSNHVLASIFIKQLYTELSMNCMDTKGKKCFRRIHFLLDEFGNMPPIEDMGGILTVCAGRNILFTLVLQSYKQIDRLYKEQADEIKENCQNHIYIMSTDVDTIEELSKRAGHKTAVSVSSNESHMDIDNKITKSSDQVRIITPDRLSQFISGEMMVIRALKRQDLERKKVRPFPILNTGETTMPYRYQFLSSLFDTGNDLNDIDIASEHMYLDLASLYLDLSRFIINYEAQCAYVNRQNSHQGDGFQQEEKEEYNEVEKCLLQLKEYILNPQNVDEKEIKMMIANMIRQYTKESILPDEAQINELIGITNHQGTKQSLVKLSRIIEDVA